MPVQTVGQEDYKGKYKILKRKLKLLIYESECFQEELHKAQRSLLKVKRDKSFLLDRLLQYQRSPDTSSDSDQTDDSDHEKLENESKNELKKRRLSSEANSSSNNISSSGNKTSSLKKKKTSHHSSNLSSSGSSHKSSISSKQITKVSKTGQIIPTKGPSNIVGNKRQPTKTAMSAGSVLPQGASGSAVVAQSDGHMSREELERHLAARPVSDFTTAVSLTLPNQLFSDNLMDGDIIDDDPETSPSNLEDDITIDNFD